MDRKCYLKMAVPERKTCAQYYHSVPRIMMNLCGFSAPLSSHIYIYICFVFVWWWFYDHSVLQLFIYVCIYIRGCMYLLSKNLSCLFNFRSGWNQELGECWRILSGDIMIGIWWVQQGFQHAHKACAKFRIQTIFNAGKLIPLKGFLFPLYF